jgi:hypothetical protein
MSKSMQRIVMLLLLGTGLGIYGLYQVFKGPTPDHVALGLFYMVPSVAAFVAVMKLPTKPVE